jgi:hypothetical protein
MEGMSGDESSGLIGRERTLKNMEEVLRRQRERLEGLAAPQVDLSKYPFPQQQRIV